MSDCWTFAGIAANSHTLREGGTFAGLSPFQNAGKVLGTANAPIHMVTTEGGQFKDQLWRTFRTIALAFLLISGAGALIEDRGISKGTIPASVDY